MYKSVDWLDEVKEKLVKEYEGYEENRFSKDYNFNTHLSNEEYREMRICFAKIYKEEASLNSFEELINSRSVREFCETLAYSNQMNNYDGISDIYNKCNQVCNFIEENYYEFQLSKIDVYIPETLTIEYIKKSLGNCDKRISNGDYDAAVADAKTLLESVFKELLTIYKVEYNEYSKLFPLLKKEVLGQLNIKVDASYDKSIIKVASGLNTIIDSVGEIRNSGSNSHLPKVDIPKHHAILAVNSAKSLVSFLFQSYLYQQSKKQELVK
ncbi:abortive infection family protein [Lysinibacillus sp. FSL L8-0312]|uniref:abortive infection family protein n=1 Tax=Lysinibacillus sp. FSL L8-0312 TaxID=2921521 RepID=UPI0030FB759E